MSLADYYGNEEISKVSTLISSYHTLGFKLMTPEDIFNATKAAIYGGKWDAEDYAFFDTMQFIQSYGYKDFGLTMILEVVSGIMDEEVFLSNNEIAQALSISNEMLVHLRDTTITTVERCSRVMCECMKITMLPKPRFIARILCALIADIDGFYLQARTISQVQNLAMTLVGGNAEEVAKVLSIMLMAKPVTCVEVAQG